MASIADVGTSRRFAGASSRRLSAAWWRTSRLLGMNTELASACRPAVLLRLSRRCRDNFRVTSFRRDGTSRAVTEFGFVFWDAPYMAAERRVML